MMHLYWQHCVNFTFCIPTLYDACCLVVHNKIAPGLLHSALDLGLTQLLLPRLWCSTIYYALPWLSFVLCVHSLPSVARSESWPWDCSLNQHRRQLYTISALSFWRVTFTMALLPVPLATICMDLEHMTDWPQLYCVHLYRQMVPRNTKGSTGRHLIN